jgi:hypothetical protein
MAPMYRGSPKGPADCTADTATARPRQPWDEALYASVATDAAECVAAAAAMPDTKESTSPSR